MSITGFSAMVDTVLRWKEERGMEKKGELTPTRDSLHQIESHIRVRIFCVLCFASALSVLVIRRSRTMILRNLSYLLDIGTNRHARQPTLTVVNLPYRISTFVLTSKSYSNRQTG